MNVARELDLVRALMRLIAKDAPRAERAGSAFLGYGGDDFLLAELLGLLIAAGYLHGRHVEPVGEFLSDDVVITGVADRGHRFLEASANALTWSHIKHLAGRKDKAVTAALLGEIASSFGMQPRAA